MQSSIYQRYSNRSSDIKIRVIALWPLLVVVSLVVRVAPITAQDSCQIQKNQKYEKLTITAATFMNDPKVAIYEGSRDINAAANY
jgi:hypothetical protein